MLRNILSVAGLSLVSRVFGFIRDVLIAQILGAGPVADAFFVAFRLPNHFRALFAEGAFNAAFVPVFAERLVRDGLDAARRFAEEVMAILLVSLFALVALIMTIMPWFIAAFAPGFSANPGKFELAVLFTRITFPYLPLICVVALLGAMLNGLKRFTAAAAAPIVLNACLIAALLGLTPFVQTPGHALAWGVMTAGVAQLAYLAWDAKRAGMGLGLVRPRLTPGVRHFLRVLGPAALGAGLVQINVLIDTVIASFLPTGAVSYLYYADRLNQLPLGVIGIAVGTVLLPEMARQLKGDDPAAAKASQNRCIELSLLLTLPAAAAFMVAAHPMMAVLFQRGAFSAADAAASANTLMAYSFGLPAFVLLKSLVPGFHARQDTTTPVRLALVAVAVNVALKVVLMGPLAQVGLAMATAVSAWVNVGLLVWALSRRGFLRFDERLRHRVPRMVFATVVMVAVVASAEHALAPAFADPHLLIRVAALAGLCAGGFAVFMALALLTGAVGHSELGRLLVRRRKVA
ncbi:MAG: murein biosynthesis integral membrane protein MurJ [Rhodospirillaceae bacterium]